MEVLNLVMWCLPIYLLGQALMLVLYKGKWRKIAAIPLLVMGPALASAGLALAQDSNLWPLIPILVAPFACIALVIIAGVHRISAPR